MAKTERKADHGDERLYALRHSTAHVMAGAVLNLIPDAKFGFGPPIADGFYYDFILSAPLTEEDFPAIEKAMRRIISQGQEFVREDLAPEAARRRLEEMGEPYKREYAEELFARQNTAPGKDSTSIPATFLRVTVTI